MKRRSYQKHYVNVVCAWSLWSHQASEVDQTIRCGVGVMKIKEYGLYNVYVDGEIILHEIFGYEVKEEVAFLKKMYAEGCGRPRKIEVRESE